MGNGRQTTIRTLTILSICWITLCAFSDNPVTESVTINVGTSHDEPTTDVNPTENESSPAVTPTTSSPDSLPLTTAEPQISSSQCNEFTFDASGSYDPDSKDLSFQWDFGDGATSTEKIATHRYDQSGKFTVKLVVTDNTDGNCNTAASAQVINVNIPPKASFTAPDQLCVGDEFTVTGMESQSDKPGNITYWWDFGDGTQQQGQSASKSYSEGGNYNVTLVVDDNAKTGCSTDRVQQKIKVNAPPQANAGEDISIGCLNEEANQAVTFDASKTSDINGDELSYHWNFGDGETGEGVKVSHLYPKSGKYDVTLTVTDNSEMACSKGEDTLVVNLNRAPVANAGPDKIACVGTQIELDGSASAEDDSQALFSKWDFGDGLTERGLKVFHAYDRPGKYKATLTVENAHSLDYPNAKDSVDIVVNSKPTVEIKAREKGCVDDEIEFEAVNTRDPDGDKLEYFWSFGDGAILKGSPKVTHKFEKGGDYKVTLVVDDGKGSDCSSVSATAMISINTPPIANAGENSACCVGESTVFNALKSMDEDGDNLKYYWDFGDGQTATEAVTNHTYERGGEYAVRLRVDDNSQTACSSSEVNFKAVINQAPVPIIQIR